MKGMSALRLAVAMAAMLFGLSGFNCRAVSREDMEKAKATTALWYLRYANNGSDYLEKLNPKSIAQLEESLKTKEKENIRAFKAVAVPTDYADWDKDKFVEYWSVTFFKSPGLAEKGLLARNKVRRLISGMTVSPPQQTLPTPAETPDSPASDSSKSSPASSAELQSAEDILSEAAASDSLALQTLPVESDPIREKNSSSTTWIYVAALVLLLGVVVWLVIFASKTMQSSKNNSEDDDDNISNPGKKSRVEEDGGDLIPEKSDSALREKFARTLAAKEEEIRSLNRKNRDLREECLRLGDENGRLSADLAKAERELDGMRGRLRAANVVASAGLNAADRDEPEILRSSSTQRNSSPITPSSGEREIFLGRVNSDGLFVRADKQPVDGKSVFVVLTQDGLTGSFRVIQNPEVLERVLNNPEHYLSGGCIAPDITDTDEADGIRTLSAGTAIFDEGCWKVLRKSKINYIYGSTFSK